MFAKRMKKEEYKAAKRRLKEASKQSLEICQHVGILSSYFAALENTLLQLVAKLINPNEPKRAEKSLSQLSFRQTIETFKNSVSQLLPDARIVEEANSLVNRMVEAATKRNDIIHSSWNALTTGEFRQHRARSKGKKPLDIEFHSDSPVNLIDELTVNVDGLIFDLLGFEDHIDKDGEQSPGADSERRRDESPGTAQV